MYSGIQRRHVFISGKSNETSTETSQTTTAAYSTSRFHPCPQIIPSSNNFSTSGSNLRAIEKVSSRHIWANWLLEDTNCAEREVEWVYLEILILMTLGAVASPCCEGNPHISHLQASVISDGCSVSVFYNAAVLEAPSAFLTTRNMVYYHHLWVTGTDSLNLPFLSWRAGCFQCVAKLRAWELLSVRNNDEAAPIRTRSVFIMRL